VTWRWNDGRTRHNVRSVGTRRFKSSTLKATGTHRVVFRRSGTYKYVCTVHPGMDGAVRVR
jgi:plastocyanin